MVGIWSMFDVFMAFCETTVHVYEHVQLKAISVALRTCGTLSRVFDDRLTCLCPHM